MKRGNNKLLNKVLAVAVTACLVFMSVPATAVADLAAGGSAEGASGASTAQSTALKDKAATSDQGASDASAQGEAPAAQPADASDAASKDAASSDSSTKAAADSADPAQSATSEAALPSDLTTFDLVEIEPVSREELTAMLAASPAAAPPSLLAGEGTTAPDYPEELDGTKVEQISVEWITRDTVEDGEDSRLSLAPSNDEPFNVRMRLNLALSGEHDYEAGDIQITIPKSIFETRDGKPTGKLTLSVPEAPDSRATFNYTDMGDYYLLTNTRKLAAATSAMFEFTVRDVVPHTIVDGMSGDNESGYDKAYATAPFEGTVQVTTNRGNTVAKSSNKIDCVIDTSEKVTSASKRAVSLSEEWPDSWPASLKPENADDYIYVDWSTYSIISGNQAFDMKVEENASTNVSKGTLLLGYKDSKSGNLYKGGDTLDFEQTLQTNDYVPAGSAFSGHAYVAYPKSNFEVNNTYTIDNSVTYTLTSADDGTVSKATAKGQVTYSPVAFKAPRGLYYVHKEGDGPATTRVDGDIEGVYGYALNQLRNGENVDLSYDISSEAFTMPATAKPTGDPDDPDTYHKRSVTLRLVDDETHFNFNKEELTASGFEFKSVSVDKPSMLLYKKFSQTGNGYTGDKTYSQTIQGGTYGYVRDDDPANIPVLYVYSKTEGGNWVRSATLDWTSGTLKASAENGASVSDSTVAFPAGTVDYKIELSTMRDGIFLSAKPTMTLKATDAVKSQVEELYANSDQPSTKASNKVTLEAESEDGAAFANMSSVGSDKLDGASLAVTQEKKATYESYPGEASVNIHYATTVSEQSNLTDLDSYNQAVASGVLQAETEGTFYDLLPMGVQVLTDTVALRSDDTITSVQTIEDYKGSGRTMLVVKAKLTPKPTFERYGAASLSGYCDKITLSFDAKYAWTSLVDYGDTVNNVVSFESGNDQLGTVKNYSGEPDNPLAGNHYNSKFATTGVEDLMTDLDPDCDTNSFTYANCNTALIVDTTAVTGLLKRVSVNNDGYFDTGLREDYPRNVYEGGRYTYSLRMQNTEESSSRNIVIYDNLENYVPTSEKSDHQDTQWRGTFSGVDVSQLKAKGIDPVVYYSTKSGLVLDDTDNRADMDLSNSDIWSTVCPDDKSTITAIAIDAIKDTEGNEFHLEKGDSIVSYVHMVASRVSDLAAPGEEGQWYDTALSAGQTEKGLTGGAHAYNNVSMIATMVSAAGIESVDQLVRNDYVKVGLIPFNIETTKTWSDSNNQDGKRPSSVTVHLYANGKDTGKSQVLSADNNWTCNWTATYDDLSPVDSKGAPIIYTFVEDEVPGYTLSVSKEEVDGVSKYTLTNKHTPEKTSLSVTKKWDDGDNAAGARPGSITLNLYREGELYRTQKVTPNASGEWSYAFTGLDKYKDGVEINYNVEEEPVPGYIATYGEGGSITNKYYPYGDLMLSKSVENATPASVDKSFTFTLSLTNASGEMDTGSYVYTTSDGRSGTIAAGGSITLKGGQTAVIKDLPSESSYSITEAAADGYTATSISGRTGIIRAGQTAQASFTNTYESAGSVQLKAQKALTGHTLANKQFSFQVLDEDGNALRSASCKADGSVTFGLVKYDSSDDGKTYTYDIQEKVPADAVNAEGITWEDATEAQKIAGGFSKKGYMYDSSRHKATVAVSDNGDGTMKATTTYEDGDVPQIENAYKATGDVTLNLWKTLAARDLKDGEFTFGLFDEQGNAVLDKDGKAITAKNAADGTVTFPTLTYDQTNVGQTITYVAKEIVPNKGEAGYDDTVVYDTTEWKFRVSVYDNGDGTLSFDQTSVSPDGEEGKLPVIANTLKPGDLTISKVATNGNPGQEFKFLVKLTSPTGESLDGDYTFKREEGVPQTVDFTTVDIDGAALPGVEYTVYKVAPDGSRTVIGNYVSDDDGNVNIQGLDKFEEGYSYIASVTRVPDGYAAPSNPDVALTYDSSTGTWSSTVAIDSPNSRAYAYYDETTQTLTLTRAKDINSLPTGKQGSIDYFNLQDLEKLNPSYTTDVPWDKYRAAIQTVVIKNRFAPLKMSAWFADCSNLESIQGMNLLDDSNLEKMGSTFKNCKKLTELDLSSFTGAKLDNMYFTFNGCSNLKTIYSSEKFSTAKVTRSDNCFAGCTSLVGGAGTTYSSSNVGVRYAHIDAGPSNPGYFTDIADKPVGAFASVAFASRFHAAVDTASIANAASDMGAESAVNGASFVSSANADEGISPQAAITSGTCGTCVWQEKPNTYTVTFDTNGGSGSMAQQSYKIDTDYQLPANSFYLFAKKFVGWNTAADGSGTSYADGATVRNLANVGGSVTLYAQWADDSSGTLTDGKMEVTLHGGESLTIRNLPAGTQYQVYEQTPSGWVLVKQSGESGVIEPLKNVQAMFTNDYQPGKTQATIVGTKTVDGDAGKVNAGDYSFELRDSGGMLLETVSCGAGGSIAFAPITYAAAGTWTYKVKEVVPQDKGNIEYDTHEETVAVTVTDDGAGNLSSSVKYDSSGVAFDNHDATPTTGHLKITKTVEGSADTSKEFTFNVVTIKDGVRNTQQVKVRAGKTVDLGEFPAGTTYTVTETDIPAGYTLKGSVGDMGTIVAEQTQEAVFTNAYAATGSAALSATKRLAGGVLAAGQFSFALRDEAGNVLQTVTNDADGAVTFEPISYTSAGTYRYTIAEVVPGQGDTGFDAAIAYDAHVEDVTVKVTDNGDGTLSAVATYDKDGAAFENSVKPGAIQLTKTVTGATDVVAGKKFPFELVLKDAQGNPLADSFSYSSTDGAKGKVKSGDVIEVAADQTVKVEDVPAGTAYSFVEQVPAGFEQKTSDATEGVVGADATASASVENAYATSGSWTPDATKVLEGSELASGQFAFLLLDSEGNVVQTAKNDADGKVVFQAIQYTGEDHGKTFEYSIVEVDDGQDNYTYDDHAAKVSVTVKDNGDGTMTVTPVYGTGDEGNIFTNLWKLIMPETGRVSYPLLAGLGFVVVLASSLGLVLRRRRHR